jgi:hypothetical protein
MNMRRPAPDPVSMVSPPAENVGDAMLKVIETARPIMVWLLQASRGSARTSDRRGDGPARFVVISDFAFVPDA